MKATTLGKWIGFFAFTLLVSQAHADFQGSINQVTRKSGGEVYSFDLRNEPGRSLVEVRAQGFRVKVYSLVVVAANGSQSELLSQALFLQPGGTALQLQSNESSEIVGVRIRAESFGGSANLQVAVRGQGGNAPDIGRPHPRPRPPSDPQFPRDPQFPNDPRFPHDPRFPGGIDSGVICTTGADRFGNVFWGPQRIEDRKFIGAVVMAQQSCAQALQASRSGVICSGATDRFGNVSFGPYRVSDGQLIGAAGMSIEQCARATTSTTGQVVCSTASDRFGNLSFGPYSLRDGNLIGAAGMSFDQCVQSNSGGWNREDVICATASDRFGNISFGVYRASDRNLIGSAGMSSQQCGQSVEFARSGVVCSTVTDRFGNLSFGPFTVRDGQLLGAGGMNHRDCLQSLGAPVQ